MIRKATGDDNKETTEKDKEKQKRLKSLSPYAQAFQMFKERRTLADVAIKLDKSQMQFLISINTT